jgi:hypothetical protein
MKKTCIMYLIAGLVLGITPILNTAAVAAHAPGGDAPGLGQPEPPAAAAGHKLPFHGKLGSVNEKEGTITVTYSTGDKVYHLTPHTEIFRNDQPAKLGDAVVGEPVSGAFHKTGDRMELTKLTLGKHGDAKDGAGKKAKPAKHAPKDAQKETAK